jgi:hypothetical protein
MAANCAVYGARGSPHDRPIITSAAGQHLFEIDAFVEHLNCERQILNLIRKSWELRSLVVGSARQLGSFVRSGVGELQEFSVLGGK